MAWMAMAHFTPPPSSQDAEMLDLVRVDKARRTICYCSKKVLCMAAMLSNVTGIWRAPNRRSARQVCSWRAPISILARANSRIGAPTVWLARAKSSFCARQVQFSRAK